MYKVFVNEKPIIITSSSQKENNFPVYILKNIVLDEIIHKELGISVTTANPFKHISLGSKINPQALGNDAPALLISSGQSWVETVL